MEVVTAREQRKPAISVLSTTLNQLWGADRVLRTVQFLSRIIANSPEISPEARLIWGHIGSTFSQTRYINRLYGTIDGIDGLLYDVPRDGPVSVRVAKAITHGCGEFLYHLLEHTALFVMLMKKCDPEKIPGMRGWLVKRGLWDRADDLDAYAQWFWLLEALAKIYLSMRELRTIAEELKTLDHSRKEDKLRAAQLRRRRATVKIDMIKYLTDIPLAVYFGSQSQGRPGLLLSPRMAGLLGAVGSVANFVVRYRNNQ